MLLGLADLVLQFRKPLAKLMNFVFVAQDLGGAAFSFIAQLFHDGLPLADFCLQHVKLMARQLSVQVLQLVRPTPVPMNNCWMSLSRQGVLLMKYSLPPSRNTRRVTVTSL